MNADRAPGDPHDLRRRFGRLAAVNILSNVTVPLMGLIDTAMLGHLDSIRFLAGVALGSILFDYVYWTFGFLRMGTTGLTAQARGAGRIEEHFFVLHRAWLLAALLGATLWVAAWPLRTAGFHLLDGTEDVLRAGRDYFDGRILGAPFALANFAMIGWFLGREEARRALVITVAAAVANTLFNAWFILGLGWAAYGAGLATALSQVAMFAIGVGFYRRIRRRPPFRPRARLRDGDWGRLLRLNGDILVRTLCLVTAFALFTNWSSRLGTLWLAANALLLRLLTLASYLIDGAAFATESLAGAFAGSGDRSGLRRLLRLSLVSGAGFAALTLAAFFVAPGPLFAALTSHADVVDAARRYLPWMIPVLAFGSAAYMYDGFFLGLTDGRTLRRSMAFSLLGVFLPVAAYAVWRGSNAWLWGAMVAFMAARALTLGFVAERRVAA